MNQTTLDPSICSDLSRIDRILQKIRPKIDFLLHLFHLFPRHVVYNTLFADGADVGRSVSFIPSTSLAVENGVVLLRFRHQTRCDYLEFPVERFSFYSSLGQYKSVGAASGFYRIDIIGEPDYDGIADAMFEDLKDRLFNFPSDFGCCGKYEECSNAMRCISDNSDLSAMCFYKKNLLRGRIFYGKNAKLDYQPYAAPKDYIVLDLETTSKYPTTAKIVEISACKVHEGKIVDWFDQMINPLCHIPEDASEINHIFDSDVSSSPCFCDIADDLNAFLGDLPLAGHNISRYDKYVLENHFGFSLDNPIIDTLILAKKHFSNLPEYNLDYLNSVFCLSLQTSHRAHADVLATKRFMSVLENPYLYFGVIGSLPVISSPVTEKKQNRKFVPYISIDIPTPQVAADESSPLYGKTIVFTGEISCSRENAMQIAVDHGMIVRNSVSKKTDYLVCGEQNPEFVGEGKMSSKQRRAIELISQGCHITLLSEEEFFSLFNS